MTIDTDAQKNTFSVFVNYFYKLICIRAEGMAIFGQLFSNLAQNIYYAVTWID